MPVTSWYPGIVLSSSDLTAPMIEAIKDCLSVAQVVGLTAWAEARSSLQNGKWVANPIDAMIDVCNVVDNRVKDRRPIWRNLDHAGVCFYPWAFSCWSPKAGSDLNHDPLHLADNFEALMNRAQHLLAGEIPSDKLKTCIEIGETFVEGKHPDLLSMATHYYATWIDPPTWSKPPAIFVAERYGHRFYAGVR